MQTHISEPRGPRAECFLNAYKLDARRIPMKNQPSDVIVQLQRRLIELERTAATKEDVAALVETLEIMGNADTMHAIAESLDDIAHGRTKPVPFVAEMLREA